MKSILYILIAVFIGSIIIPPFQNGELNAQTITVQCSNDNPSAEALSKSADIIKSRLADFGLHEVDVRINKPASSLTVSLNSDVDPESLDLLMTTKGMVGFFEVRDRLEILQELAKNSELASILYISTDETKFARYSGILGFCKADQKSDAVRCLQKNNTAESLTEVDFCWSEFPDQEGNVYLYGLKHQASMDNSGIADSKVQSNVSDKKPELMIWLNETGTLKWKDITLRNLGRAIVIVLDHKVLCAPIVKSEISTGKCIITGDFTFHEITLLNALIGNEVLPLEFKLKN